MSRSYLQLLKNISIYKLKDPQAPSDKEKRYIESHFRLLQMNKTALKNLRDMNSLYMEVLKQRGSSKRLDTLCVLQDIIKKRLAQCDRCDGNCTLCSIIPLNVILLTILSEFGISKDYWEQHCKNNRKEQSVKIKQYLCYIAYYEGHTSTSIGKFLNIDHSTVINNKKRAKNYLDTEKEYRNIYNNIDKKLQAYRNKASHH